MGLIPYSSALSFVIPTVPTSNSPITAILGLDIEPKTEFLPNMLSATRTPCLIAVEPKALIVDL